MSLIIDENVDFELLQFLLCAANSYDDVKAIKSWWEDPTSTLFVEK